MGEKVEPNLERAYDRIGFNGILAGLLCAFLYYIVKLFLDPLSIPLDFYIILGKRWNVPLTLEFMFIGALFSFLITVLPFFIEWDILELTLRDYFILGTGYGVIIWVLGNQSLNFIDPELAIPLTCRSFISYTVLGSAIGVFCFIIGKLRK